MAKNPGLGTLLQHGAAGTPIVYTTIAQRSKVDGPSAEVGTRETTDLDSEWKEYEPTLPDGGEVSLTIYYDPASTTHALLFGFLGVPSVELWRLQFADLALTKFDFSAILTKFSPTGMEVEGNLEAECTLKVTGPITPSTPAP